MSLAQPHSVDETFSEWESERQNLMARKISELGLSIPGSRVERMVDQLYRELDAKGLALKPPVYLSDQWGCPDGTPLIGVPGSGQSTPSLSATSTRLSGMEGAVSTA